MVAKGFWHGIKMGDLDAAEPRAIIRSTMFLHDKYRGDESFE